MSLQCAQLHACSHVRPPPRPQLRPQGPRRRPRGLGRTSKCVSSPGARLWAVKNSLSEKYFVFGGRTFMVFVRGSIFCRYEPREQATGPLLLLCAALHGSAAACTQPRCNITRTTRLNAGTQQHQRMIYIATVPLACSIALGR